MSGSLHQEGQHGSERVGLYTVEEAQDSGQSSGHTQHYSGSTRTPDVGGSSQTQDPTPPAQSNGDLDAQFSSSSDPTSLAFHGMENYDSSIGYNPILGVLFNPYDPSSGSGMSSDMHQHLFTHVDPTQILNGLDANGDVISGTTTYAPSPSSDEWRTPSSTASPEPVTSNALSGSSGGPGPAEGMAGPNAQRSTGRKIASIKRSQSSLSQRRGSTLQTASPVVRPTARKPTGDGNPEGLVNSQSSAPSPVEDGDSVPTVCTNCSTTTTPLWRRDPEGHPLCEYLDSPINSESDPSSLLGNACGLFYVGGISMLCGLPHINSSLS